MVELNNQLAEIATAEREEEDRIVRELSAWGWHSAADIVVLVEATGATDLAHRPRDSFKELARRSPESRGLRVVCWCTPSSPPTCDRLFVHLDLGELRALVVSGPIRGGKTVALKTIGLFALLQLPASGGGGRIPSTRFANIGDEQSIEMIR